MTILILTLVMFGQGEALDAPKAPPAHDPSEQAWRGMYTANFHVRYHLAKAGESQFYARVLVLTMILLPVPVLGIAILSTIYNKKHGFSWYVFNFLTVILLISLIVSALLSKINQAVYANCRTRWAALSTEYEILWNDIESHPDPQKQLNELLDEMNSIEKDEPSECDMVFLGECQEAENRSWGWATARRTSED